VQQTTQLITAVRAIGVKFALEHFGAGRDSQRLIATCRSISSRSTAR
jgi:EAL domain-containing protein (putative c-di-GMP-specific phosphodiesterase class I)